MNKALEKQRRGCTGLFNNPHCRGAGSLMKANRVDFQRARLHYTKPSWVAAVGEFVAHVGERSGVSPDVSDGIHQIK